MGQTSPTNLANVVTCQLFAKSTSKRPSMSSHLLLYVSAVPWILAGVAHIIVNVASHNAHLSEFSIMYGPRLTLALSASCRECTVASMWEALFWWTQLALGMGLILVNWQIPKAGGIPQTHSNEKHGSGRTFALCVALQRLLSAVVWFRVMGWEALGVGVFDFICFILLGVWGYSQPSDTEISLPSLRSGLSVTACTFALGSLMIPLKASLTTASLSTSSLKPVSLSTIWSVSQHNTACQTSCPVSSLFACVFLISLICSLLPHCFSRATGRWSAVSVVSLFQAIAYPLIVGIHIQKGTVGRIAMTIPLFSVAIVLVLIFHNRGHFAGAHDRVNVFDSLLRYARVWWYIWVVGALSCLNSFVMMLSTPLFGLFVAGVLAKPSRLPLAAFANACGVAVGAGVLVWGMYAFGTETVVTQFPSVFESSSWEWSRDVMQQHGLAGVFLLCTLPVVLQPVLLLAVLAQLSPGGVVLAVLLGRTIKYLMIGIIALRAPHFLRLFGSRAVDSTERVRHNLKAD